MAVERQVTVIGTAASAGALLSAAACCVLPLVFAAVGLGAGGLAAFVPYHWPLTIGASLAVAAGWGLYVSKQRACARDPSCPVPGRATLWMLGIATAFLILSAAWKALLEQPLTKMLGGA